jgi:hypothetical protein
VGLGERSNSLPFFILGRRIGLGAVYWLTVLAADDSEIARLHPSAAKAAMISYALRHG